MGHTRILFSVIKTKEEIKGHGVPRIHHLPYLLRLKLKVYAVFLITSKALHASRRSPLHRGRRGETSEADPWGTGRRG